MNYNGGPERLIAQMKQMTGISDGFQITSRLKTSRQELLLEFRPFKEFVNEASGVAGLKRSGEFYFNFADSGFTGIVCFNGSYYSLHTHPAGELIYVDIFMSDKVLNNINIGEVLYRNSIHFFNSFVMEVNYQSL
jgi:S-adenosylmethionine/arginine decarboxylase-like enzyme